MASNITNIRKLQQAINLKGYRILYNTGQFYSTEQDRPVTIYYVKQAVWNRDKNKFDNIELFKSTSQIQILLFLRDYWYEINGKEVPTGNEEWNKAKEEYFKKSNIKNAKT